MDVFGESQGEICRERGKSDTFLFIHDATSVYFCVELRPRSRLLERQKETHRSLKKKKEMNGNEEQSLLMCIL